MLPNQTLITIHDNQALIEKLLMDLVLKPRIKALEWSKITKQTPNLKIGYPGQHLASLVLGMEGSKTGARGHDIIDGSEVKSCSRVDQLDSCKDCGEKVLRIEPTCPRCNSLNIKRMDDSKWLFTIRSENDLTVLTETVNRVVLTIADYPEFDSGNFEDLRFQVFEIWPQSPRNSNFVNLMRNYFDKIYLGHKQKDSNKTPAPKNFWPYSYQFYICNPIKIFSCTVENANTNPKIMIDHYVSAETDRNMLSSEPMPTHLLSKEEIALLTMKTGLPINDLPTISEEMRGFLTLRDTDKISEAKQVYRRN